MHHGTALLACSEILPDVKDAMTALGATHTFIRPTAPGQRQGLFNRTLASEWGYRQVFTTRG